MVFQKQIIQKEFHFLCHFTKIQAALKRNLLWLSSLSEEQNQFKYGHHILTVPFLKQAACILQFTWS